ncbi:hypothetical protein BGZ68_010706 [Mortierella alpina]|nr:hypothetical protein BGZ68_010706 [Mortierella alpina]
MVVDTKQRDAQLNSGTPEDEAISVNKSTSPNEGSVEAKAHENVVKHEQPSAQEAFGLPSPPYEDSSDPSPDDDQQRRKKNEPSEAPIAPQDLSVVQADQNETEETLAEELESSESAVPAFDDEDPRNTEEEHSVAETAQGLESEEDDEVNQTAVLTDDEEDVTGPLEKLDIQPARIQRAPGAYFYATTETYKGISILKTTAATGCLFLRGHLFRHKVSRFNERKKVFKDFEYYVPGQGDVVVASRSKFEACTADFHPLVKQNFYYLIKDYLLVLGADPDKKTILRESPSVIGRKYRKAGKDRSKHRKLRVECEKHGQVYMLVSSPRSEDLDRMWFAGSRVRDPQKTLPVKIGQSEDIDTRFEQHEKCGIKAEPHEIFREIDYVHLFELMIHELCVAHQHDLLCGCQTDPDKNHIEVFWFERLSGGTDLHGDFEAIVKALRSDIKKCRRFVKLLGRGLSHVHTPMKRR